MKTTSITYQVFVLFLLFQAVFLSAQNETTFNEPKYESNLVGELSLSGSADVYFHNAIGTIEDAPHTSFANLPGFSLGMINLILSYKSNKTGIVADMVYGPRGEDAVFKASHFNKSAGNGSARIVNQLYVYYKFSDDFTLNLGQFNTFLGYEVISPIPNFHYSTSYLFSYGPFSHTGLRADFTLGSGWLAKVAVMNPTDFTAYNPFETYTLGAQIGFEKDDGSIYLNVTTGDQDGRIKKTDSINSISTGKTLQVDLTAGIDLSKKYYLGVNASYQGIQSGEVSTPDGITNYTSDTYGFYGVVVYHKYAVSETLAVGLRAELFNEFEGGVGAIGGYNEEGDSNITEITLSANYTDGGFRVIPEIRMDSGSERTFTRSSNGPALNTMMSFNIAVVYTIPSISYKIHAKN